MCWWGSSWKNSSVSGGSDVKGLAIHGPHFYLISPGLRFLSVGFSKIEVFVLPIPQLWKNWKHEFQLSLRKLSMFIWEEFQYWLDVCRTARGVHIEHLWAFSSKLRCITNVVCFYFSLYAFFNINVAFWNRWRFFWTL